MKGRIRYWLSMGLLAFSLTAAGQSQEMVLINQGVRLHDAGKYNEAIACYDKVLKMNPHSARAMSEMAMSLLHLQRYEEALRYSTRVINMHNEALLLSASIVKSSALSGLQRYDDAVRLLEDLLPKYGDDELLLYNLSVGYQQLEKWDKAIACIEKAIDANEYNSTYYQQYAELLEEEERYVEAYFSTMAALLYDATNDDAKQLCEALTELLRENISTSDNAGVLPAGMDKSISQRLQKIAPPTNGYERQEVHRKPTIHAFPLKELTYLGNVSNQKAKLFYEQHNAKVIQPAFEIQQQTDVPLMFTRHCIKQSLGWCPKEGKGKHPYAEPFFLTNERVNLRLEFDCKKCEMRVYQA